MMSETPEAFGYALIVGSYHSPFTGGDNFSRMETETRDIAMTADPCILVF
jgi:hypothetical protein